jgi:hypothetical protein
MSHRSDELLEQARRRYNLTDRLEDPNDMNTSSFQLSSSTEEVVPSMKGGDIPNIEKTTSAGKTEFGNILPDLTAADGGSGM